MLPVGAVEQLELLVNVLLDDPAQQAPERCDLRRWFHGYKKKAPEVIAVHVGGGAARRCRSWSGAIAGRCGRGRRGIPVAVPD